MYINVVITEECSKGVWYGLELAQDAGSENEISGDY